MKKRGWQVYGVEFSKNAYCHAQERLGPVIFQGDIRDAQYGNNTFDIVTLWHTLEHLTTPLETLREIRRILKPEGLLFIEVPNINFLENYFFRFFGITKHLFFMEHLVHFSPKTLKNIVRKAGFIIKGVTSSDVTVAGKDYKTMIGVAFAYLGKSIYFLTGLNLVHGIRLVGAKEE